MVPEIKTFSWIARLVAVTAGLALPLGACGGVGFGERPTGQLGPAQQQQLNSSLKVASAAADAGQIEAAKRLYTELSRHFPSAPEPRLGLGYLALEARDFTLAGKLFAEAGERSVKPAAKAEALLGAGRASLGTGDTAAAKNHFLTASKLAGGTPAAAWVANGLGVVATIEGDHARARTHYEEALTSSPGHPLITANLVRALAQSGEGSEARRLYAKYPVSYWLDGDGVALSGLLKDKKEKITALEKKTALAALASGAKVQLFSARSRDRALTAWNRLSSEEKDLLGSLAHRVVKVEIPKRGVFYRLRAGPMADKAAARRLCGQLKRRGRDCLVLAGKWSGGSRTGTATKSADPPSRGDHEAARSRPRVVATGANGAAAAGAMVQLYSARSRSRALAAWGRLFAEEKELLGSLNHRVVKAEIPDRGVFYRLRAGPLADRAAARRLCGLLKARGRDCFVPAGTWAPGGGVGTANPSAIATKGEDSGSDDAQGTARFRPQTVAAAVPESNGTVAAGTGVQLHSARSRARALAAWGRLSTEEKDLLGSLTHRVVKAEVPNRGVFYRLRVGPLADKAAARRLCGLLKGRGRDCFVPAAE